MILRIELSINPSILNNEVIDIHVDADTKKVLSGSDKTAANTAIESKPAFQDFMRGIIVEKAQNGHTRTAEAYKSALNSFNRFLDNQLVQTTDITENLMERYESYLINRSICLNTVSFYMRILKAVYKRAVKKKYVVDIFPFQQVYTGVAKTQKRSVGLDGIRKIKEYVPKDDREKFARDMFMFSFYTRGMSFVDMAMLKKTDISGAYLQYRRKKTGQMIRIKWEPSMQAIVDEHKPYNDIYLLPIIRKVGKGERNQYRYTQFLINKGLKSIGEQLCMDTSLTMYVARHSWASIAKSIDVPLNIISEAMGHTSEKMTTIYLSSIDETKIHKENERIINLILKK